MRRLPPCWRKTKQQKTLIHRFYPAVNPVDYKYGCNSETNVREIVSHFWLYLRCSPQEEAHIWYCKSSHDFANQTQYRTPLHICSSVNRLVQLSDMVREVLCATDSGQCKNSQLDKVQRINRNRVLIHKWNIYIASLPLKFRPHKGRRHGKILRVRDSVWNCSIFWKRQDICTHELLTAVAVVILSWGDKIITPNPRREVYWQMMTAWRERVNVL